MADEPSGMPNTMWTMISRARQGGQEALDTLLRKYRSPVLAFIRRSGFSPEEAEDLTQEVFLTLIRDDVLSNVDPSQGRFRRLILALVRHAISKQRRYDGRLKHGGDRKRVFLHGEDPDSPPRLEDLLAAPETDDAFDPLWIQNLVWIGMNRLRDECDREGIPYFQALLLHASHGLGYAEIAGRLGASATDVKNYLHQARLRLRRHVLKEVQAYSSSRDEYEAEAAHLMRFLE